VEVSDAYLSACEARIVFVRTPQTGLSDLMQSHCTVYAETTDLDRGDIAITFERALTRTRDVEVHFSLPLFPSA
jgi:hypothetical protein